jgi:hypothetical protein
MDNASGILERPLGPGVLRACQCCKRWFALRCEAVRADKLLGQVRTYRCQHCQSVVEAAERLPPKAI